MDERTFNDWLGSLPALTAAQKQRLETALSGSDPATNVARELDVLGVSECPHCAAGAPVRCGHANGITVTFYHVPICSTLSGLAA